MARNKKSNNKLRNIQKKKTGLKKTGLDKAKVAKMRLEAKNRKPDSDFCHVTEPFTPATPRTNCLEDFLNGL